MNTFNDLKAKVAAIEAGHRQSMPDLSTITQIAAARQRARPIAFSNSGTTAVLLT